MGCTGRAFQDSIKSFNGNSVLHLLFYLHSFTFVLLPTSCAVSLRKKDSDLVLTSQVDSLSLMPPPPSHKHTISIIGSLSCLLMSPSHSIHLPSSLLISPHHFYITTIKVMEKKTERNSFAVKYLGNADW